jgi:hypothetical protein
MGMSALQQVSWAQNGSPKINELSARLTMSLFQQWGTRRTQDAPVLMVLNS